MQLPLESATEFHLVARPCRSATAAQLKRVVLGFGLVSLLVTGYAATQGNIVAPLFGLLNFAAVAIAFRLVWLQGEDRDEFFVVGDELVIAQARGGRCWQERVNAWWARVVLEADPRPNWPPRVLLCSHGRELEVGSFLAADARAELASRLGDLLLSVRSNCRHPGEDRRA
ncbi:MAG: DUF2244 domain-containing protein [Xanthomonadales bacterium]|jgi:uncharacterized membrane protein|nr:DUF2244 domain-containing protein [Xanthomonadales bacterium]